MYLFLVALHVKIHPEKVLLLCLQLREDEDGFARVLSSSVGRGRNGEFPMGGRHHALGPEGRVRVAAG